MTRRILFLGLLLTLFLVATATAETKVRRVYTGKLNVNTASAADLARLPGIGEVIAYRVVKEREERGPFRETRALQRIKGISPRTYAGLKNYVATTGENTLQVFIDLNTVTRSLLLGLPGMTAEQARSILNYRQTRGGFTATEELRNVPGVSAKRYAELAQWLTVAR